MVACAYQVEQALFKVQKTEQCLQLSLDEPYTVLSSAELNGGFATSQHFLNYRVDNCPFEDLSLPSPPSPADSLLALAAQQSLPDSTVGMMTAASMNSFRMASAQIDTVRITLALTCGLSNARCAGDSADYPHLFEAVVPLGTINTFVAINHPMQPKALVEAHSLIAEARATTLQRLGIQSEISSQLATGTGTDSTAIACKPINVAIQEARTGIAESSSPPIPIDYCGKHVILAEVLANLMIACLTASINREAVKPIL
ncbi:MAG: adenosylcobinamide amidohydrolase [Gammaproteobacteria bacterium]|nr:adenosylcobinamide amidohydrolase [Gammaproteobacteria bacterium]